MKNTIKLMLLLVLTIVSGTSCKRSIFCVNGKGSIQNETRILSDFNEVDMQISGSLEIIYDSTISTPEITIEAQENILEELRTEVKGDRLVIKFQNCVQDAKSVTMYLKVAHLGGTTLSGSGDIDLLNAPPMDDFDVVLSGSGNIHFHKTIYPSSFDARLSGSGNMDILVQTNDLSATISGSGGIELDGACTTADLDITGSGDFRAFGMPSEICNITISGSGEAEVTVTKQLTVSIRGSGDVYYKGQPQLDVDISGSGWLVNAN